MARITAIISFILLVSCSPGQRLHRLIKKHPELTRIDTVKVKDSIFIKGNVIDSNFIFTGDTVRIENGRQEIKYFYNTTTHHNYIQGKIRDTIIYKEVRVPVEKIIDRGGYKLKDLIIIWVIPSLILLLYSIYKFTSREKAR